MCAQLRLLWILQNPLERFAFPARLTSRKCPAQYTLPITETLYQELEEFWDGKSDRFLESISLQLLDPTETQPALAPFLYRTIQDDLTLLKTYFQTAPAKNKALKKRFKHRLRLIPQDLIDDWLAIHRIENTAQRNSKKVQAES